MDYVTQPTLLIGLVLAAAVVHLWRNRQEGRRRLLAVVIPLVLLALVSLPVTAHLALGTLEWPYPPVQLSQRPGALVVLSGYMHPPEEGDDQPRLAIDSFYRCRHALRLYREVGGCPVLVSGGPSSGVPGGPPLAEAMRSFLIEAGVKPADILVENRSQTTYENALNSCALLEARGIEHIVLVTDAKHMARAARCFRKQGMDVTPAPCNYVTTKFHNDWRDYLPSPEGALKFQAAVHEWVGLAYYWLRGWT